jgi:hypothetical protein
VHRDTVRRNSKAPRSLRQTPIIANLPLVIGILFLCDAIGFQPNPRIDLFGRQQIAKFSELRHEISINDASIFLVLRERDTGVWEPLLHVDPKK